VLALGLLWLAGCRAAKGEKCAKTNDCKKGLSCIELTCQDPAAAGPDAICRASKGCQMYGLCSAGVGDSCRATSDADCRASKVCKRWGTCTAAGAADGELSGSCHATSTAICKATPVCRLYGKCTASKGKCQAVSDADCAGAAVACKRYRKCTASGGECVKKM